MRTVVVVPAYNEARTVTSTVCGLLSVADRVLVVDDGSSDATGPLAAAAGATVIRHPLNRGLGAALGTGIAAAIRDGADAVITFDADGQHRPADVQRIAAPIIKGEADAVIGSRTLDRHKMPLARRLANWTGNALTWALFGIWVSDSQSGLRGLSRRAAQEIDIRTDRMEVSSEIVKEIRRHGWRLAEIPIEPVYSEYSLSKGQGFIVGLKTAGKLILRRLMG